MNILVTDDEKLIVDDLIHDVLEIYPDASVDGASNAETALKLADTKRYDIALLDVDMPGVNGINLAKKLLASNPSLNVIFVTGYNEYALEAHEVYCSGYLMKPVGVRKLRKAFEHLRNPFIDIPEDFIEDHYSGNAVIGNKLKMFRQQRGISRQELADRMDVTRQTVYRWEQGERMPDVLSFVRLAKVLGIGIKDILNTEKDTDQGSDHDQDNIKETVSRSAE